MSRHRRWFRATRKSSRCRRALAPWPPGRWPAPPSSSRFTSPRYFMKNGVGGHLSWKGASSWSRDLSYLNGKASACGFEEEVEWVQHRHLRNQVHFHQELAGRLRQDKPRQVVRLRVLLPVDEVLFRRDAQRVAQDARAAMRRGPQAHDLRPQRHRPVIAVVRLVVESDVDGHAGASPPIASAAWASFLPGCGDLEREERLEDALADLVHLGLQVIQIFVQAALDYFVHRGEGEVRAELAEQLLRRHGGRCPAACR